jgi:hypothetical protein
MPASTHQLAASAYHLKPSDVRKLLLAATNFRDRCLIKTLWWLGVRRRELLHLGPTGGNMRYHLTSSTALSYRAL